MAAAVGYVVAQATAAQVYSPPVRKLIGHCQSHYMERLGPRCVTTFQKLIIETCPLEGSHKDLKNDLLEKHPHLWELVGMNSAQIL